MNVKKIRILVVDDIAETRENVAKLVGLEADMEIVASASGGEQAIEMAKRHAPDVILMDINMPPGMDGIAATEIISHTIPDSPIIMMSIQGENDYLRRSMLAGAREFLVKPFSADELVNAIRHVHELQKLKRARAPQQAAAAIGGASGNGDGPGRQPGRIICFFSPKGGVGRTTISTNLAVALRQSTGEEVVLVDGSLAFGDIAVILNMPAKAKTIADLVGSFDALDPDILDTLLVTHSSGIKVLLAPPDPEAAERITAANMKSVIELLRERHAYVVVDTWPSFQEIVLTMLDTADVIVTLMTLEITSLKNVRVFLEIAEKLGYPEDKVQLVANRNDSTGGIKAADVEASLGRRITHTIVSDGRTLVQAVNRGIPFAISHRDSQVAKDVFGLAAKLAVREGDEEAAVAVPARRTRRLFGSR